MAAVTLFQLERIEDRMGAEFNKHRQSKNSVLQTGLLRAVIKANNASFLSSCKQLLKSYLTL